jgi:hypothetical protein
MTRVGRVLADFLFIIRENPPNQRHLRSIKTRIPLFLIDFCALKFKNATFAYK